MRKFLLQYMISMANQKRPAENGIKMIKIDIKMIFIAIFVIFFILTIIAGSEEFMAGNQKSISSVIKDIKAGKVEKIERTGNTITAVYKNDTRVQAKKESEDSLRKILQESGVNPDKIVIDVKSNDDTSLFIVFLNSILPTILLSVSSFLSSGRLVVLRTQSSHLGKLNQKDIQKKCPIQPLRMSLAWMRQKRNLRKLLIF